MIHQCPKCGQEATLMGQREVCSTSGCPNWDPSALYLIILAKRFAAMGYTPVAHPGMPMPTREEPKPREEPPLYETSDAEKLEAGGILKERQSIMDGWRALEKRGYTLARRTKPEVKK